MCCFNKVFALVDSPLTKVKLINQLNEREANLGVKETVSWHSEYKDSAWIFIGKFRMSVIMVLFSHHMFCRTTVMLFLVHCRRISI